ncbi:MAG: hypothetical protein ACT6XY_05375 [Phreatobacter sp.]|uniref:hypothetical protein n=1 Tax=Phreatobacter sp. TaxID=1966341 RepID=UPI0040370950
MGHATRHPLLVSKVASNAAFLVPCLVAFTKGLIATAALTLAVAIVSAFYHLSDETHLRWLDQLLALCLVATNVYMLAAAGIPLPNAPVAVLLSLHALYHFYFRGEDDWQWHCSSAAITICCVLAHTS